MNRALALLRRKRVWIPLAILLAYTLFGFLVLPGILRGQIVQGIRQNLKREAKLAKVRVNPLFLALTLEGFELQDPDGTPFVAFDRLHVDFQLSSLVRWALTFREFRLDGPRVHVRLMPDGQPNFMDLVPKEEGRPPRLILGSLQIHSGSVTVTNLMAAEPEEATLAPIDLTLENFTTIPQKEGLYRIAATDQGNGAWQWTGDLTFEPMHSAGVLEISGSRLRRLWEIARNRVGFEIGEGQAGCRLQYEVDVRGDSLIARLHDSSLTLAGFTVREKGKEPDLLELDSLTVEGLEVRYPEQSASIARVLVAGTKVKAWLEPDSTLNWLSVLAPPGGSTAAPAGARSPAPAPTGAAPAPSPRTSGVPASGAPATAGPASSSRPSGAPASGTPVPAPATASPAPEWTVTLGELAVRDFALDFEDRTTEPAFAVSVAPVHLTVRNVSSRPGAAFDLATDITIAGKGRLGVSGTVAARPPALDLAVRLADLPLPIFQPYLNPLAKLQLVSGTLGVAGDVRFREGRSRPDVRFQGRVESRGFLTRDRIANERFLAWKSVEVNAIDFAPERVSVGSVRLTEPFAKLLIHRDRTTNVQDILGIAPVDSAAAVAAAPAPAGREKKGGKPAKPQPRASEALATMQDQAAAAAPVVPVRIGTVEVVNGSADFADLSLILPFAASIEGLAGTVTGLSSDSAARAAVTLDGRVQPSGTAQVRGAINPLAEEVFLDLGVVFRGFNMPVLSPYAGQFLGREIDKGRMSLDLGYRLQGRHLVGENKIELDQLELGKKVESPEATRLPVGLAIAILKDKNGKIDLDVPVEGDIDDPKLRIGKVIWDFIMSLLKKVATAPFALLGGLLGGGGEDQLSHVDFEAGLSAVPEDQKESLGRLAEALGKRPQLGLEVRGRSDRDADAAAIRKAKFESLAGERMAAEPKKYGGGPGYPPRLLEDLYVERFGKKGLASLEERHEVPAGELPQDHPQFKSGSKKRVVNQPAMHGAIRDTLTALQRADESDLLSLANARANAIKQRLVEQGIEEARLYVVDPEPGRIENGRIRIELTLTD